MSGCNAAIKPVCKMLAARKILWIILSCDSGKFNFNLSKSAMF